MSEEIRTYIAEIHVGWIKWLYQNWIIKQWVDALSFREGIFSSSCKEYFFFPRVIVLISINGTTEALEDASMFIRKHFPRAGYMASIT